WKVGDNTEWEVVEVDRLDTALPTVAELHQNYPNPFNATTNISYSLAEPGNISLKVYDICGRLVVTLVDGQTDAGQQVVAWDASTFPSGVYFYKLTAGDFTAAKRTMLVK
ncbi:MAG: T9SS type A sorting domain-containing protein, partial [Candidatus Zixiibacteriota bacterium]